MACPVAAPAVIHARNHEHPEERLCGGPLPDDLLHGLIIIHGVQHSAEGIVPSAVSQQLGTRGFEST